MRMKNINYIVGEGWGVGIREGEWRIRDGDMVSIQISSLMYEQNGVFTMPISFSSHMRHCFFTVLVHGSFLVYRGQERPSFLFGNGRTVYILSV